MSNSMKLSNALWGTQDRRVMVERSDRMWSTGEGNGKPLQYSCLENPMNSMKRQNDRISKEELPRSLGAQYATGDQWRNKSRKNEAAAAVLQSCLTLCDPRDGSPPGFLIPGVLQARILKCLAIPLSSGPHSVRPLHHDPPVLGCPAGMAWFH